MRRSYKVFRLIKFPSSGGIVPENWFASSALVKNMHSENTHNIKKNCKSTFKFAVTFEKSDPIL